MAQAVNQQHPDSRQQHADSRRPLGSTPYGAGQRPVSTVRKVIAVVLIAIAAFVIAFGAGGGSWPVIAVGAAGMVVAIGLLLVQALRGGERAWIPAAGHVVAVSPPPANGAYGRAELQLVLTAPSMPTTAVKVRDPRVPVALWPSAGASLPVLVAVDDRRHVRIQWDDVAAPDQVNPDPQPHVDDYDYARMPGSPFTDPDADDAPTDAPTAAGTTTSAIPVPTPPLDDEPPSWPLAAPGAAQVPSARRPSASVTTAGDPPLSVPARPSPARSVTRPPLSVGTTLSVRDLDRSISFYRDMLGFQLIDRSPTLAILATGDTRLVLLPVDPPEAGTIRLTHVNLEVGDVDATHQALSEAGVDFTAGPAIIGQGERLALWAATFTDPDGHGLALTQWRASSAEDRPPYVHQIGPDEAEDNA